MRRAALTASLAALMAACGGDGGGATPAGGGGEGSGGSPPSGACVPGETVECYSGPIGTKAVGACKAGTQTCLADGEGYGPCEGEVLPAPETCATAEDDDCDGMVNEEGEGCSCLPGTVTTCYSGPRGTEGVGACIAGILTCNELGTGYGPCEGEVTPQAEDCSTDVDDDCDGVAPSCPAVWAHRYGNASSQFAWSLAADASGNVFVVGDLEGSADFGGGTLTSQGSSDVFVTKLDASGTHAFSNRYGNNALQSAQAAAVSGDDVVITGYFQGSVAFGGGTLTTSGGADIFLAKLTASGGHVWSKKLGNSADDQLVLAVAVAPDGSVIVVGSYTGTINFGGGNLASAGGSDIFVAKYAGDTGNHVWSKRFGDAAINQAALAVACDAAGNVLVAGEFDGTVDFGGGSLASAGGLDAFVAKFDPTGAHVYSRAFGDGLIQTARAVTVDTSGRAIVAIDFEGSVEVGGVPVASVGNQDVLLARLDASGALAGYQVLAGSGGESARGLAATAGRVAVTGYFEDTATLGSRSLVSLGGRDIFVMELAEADLAPITARSFGGADYYQSGQGVAYDASGNLFVAGYFFGTADFGSGPLTSAGGADIFVAKFTP